MMNTIHFGVRITPDTHSAQMSKHKELIEQSFGIELKPSDHVYLCTDDAEFKKDNAVFFETSLPQPEPTTYQAYFIGNDLQINPGAAMAIYPPKQPNAKRSLEQEYRVPEADKDITIFRKALTYQPERG